MMPDEKYDLARMLAEIEDDILDQTADVRQLKGISQDVITNLMLDNLKKKKKTTPPDAVD
ncbi:MAG: hypothetical protein MUE70_01395 [Desulfobacterales bacterium]|jgi:hypothetical protein|nr:hypothetical protein [Desulfobacterales bacterium]